MKLKGWLFCRFERLIYRDRCVLQIQEMLHFSQFPAKPFCAVAIAKFDIIPFEKQCTEERKIPPPLENFAQGRRLGLVLILIRHDQRRLENLQKKHVYAFLRLLEVLLD